MNYNLKGTEVQITDELRTHVERQLERADKLSHDPAAHADVELVFDTLRDGDQFRAEFTFARKGKVYRADTWAASMYEAIDRAGDELLSELRTAKNKRLHRLRHTALRAKEYLRGWRNKI